MKKYTIYNGKINLIFDERQHKYYIESKEVPTVTNILKIINKPGIVHWAVNQVVREVEQNLIAQEDEKINITEMLNEAKKAHEKVRDLSANIGTQVHTFAEMYIKNQENAQLPAQQEAKKAAEAFMKWLKSKKNIKFIFIEKKVYSKKYNYAGTVDFIANIDGKVVVGDFKTSKKIYDQYFYQTAGYQQAIQEEFQNMNIQANMIVRLGKDGTYEEKVNNQFDKNMEAFLAARTIYLREKELDVI
jgi:hypothetical protein